jgi:pimeloyl-ACP methyl ester carboxylesterase
MSSSSTLPNDIEGTTLTTDDGTEIFYRRKGDRNAKHRILLVTGYNSSHESWSRVESEFVKGDYQCVVMDNRGTGFSTHVNSTTIQRMALDVLLVADKVGWHSFTAVGHSMGGMIVQHVALLAPQRIDALVLSCTRLFGGMWNTLPTWTGIYRFARIRLARDSREEMDHSLQFLFPSEYLEAKYTQDDARFADNRSWLEHMFQSRRAPKTKHGGDAQLAAVQAHHLDDEQVAKIRDGGFPILVVYGEEDVVIPVRHSTEAAAALNAKLRALPGAGHAIAFQCPELFVQAIVELLDRTEARTNK